MGFRDYDFTEIEKNENKRMILFYNSIEKDKECTLAWEPIQEFAEEQIQVLQENHNLVGHSGIQKTYDRIRD